MGALRERAAMWAARVRNHEEIVPHGPGRRHRLPHHWKQTAPRGMLDLFAASQLEKPAVLNYAWRAASISIEILTSSPTTTPPASSAMLNVMPKSLRRIFVSAVAPMR
jgi:hypothetical protein